MPADRQGPDQLHPARLLLAAGEPGRHEQRHEGHHHEPEGADLERHLAAVGVETLGRPVEGEGGGVVL
jgi:hypothetical protein